MALFIGGPLDGQMVQVEPTRTHVEVAIQHPLESLGITPEPNKPSKLTDIFYYKREILNCPTTEFPIFVPRSYNCTDVMTALIEGYHKSVIQSDE